MDLRWAIDEALDGLRGTPLEALGVPDRSWGAFCVSTGHVEDFDRPIEYRGVLIERAPGVDLNVRLRPSVPPVPAEAVTLQGFSLAPPAGCQPLYFIIRSGRADQSDGGLRLSPGAVASFDTFFNSFYERYWTRQTQVRAVALTLAGVGEAWCSVWRGAADGSRQRLVRQRVRLEEGVALPLALAEADDSAGGRLYAEIEAAEGPVRLERLAWTALQPPRRRVRLGVGICTHNREPQLTALLQRLGEAGPGACLASVVVVNQGRPLASLPPIGVPVQVVAQPNHGGAGGFTRAAITLMDEGDLTHVLFMDDDVELEPTGLLAAAALLSYADQPVVLGGHMLDACRPTRLFDGGGRVSGGAVNSNNRRLDLTDPVALDALSEPTQSDFNGWWLAVIPVEAFRTHGLPLPLFIHVDDVEFGVRLTEAGMPTVTLPPVAVWHEPYTAKPPGWFGFYDVRNWLIFASLYPDRYPLERPLPLLKRAVSLAIRYDHLQAAGLRLGIEAFLRGPNDLGAEAPALHERVSKGLAPLAQIPMGIGDAPPADASIPTGRMARRLRLIGNLARALGGRPMANPAGPNCVLEPDAPIDLMRLGPAYLMKSEDGDFSILFQHNGVEGRRRFWALCWTICHFALGARAAARRWRIAHERLVSPATWAATLALPRRQDPIGRIPA